MSALILRSKIWPNESTQAINYKEKNFKKQKISIESSGIIFRQKDKVYFKKTEESNLTSNSNDNTNYMNEKKIELLSISKQQDNKFIINCGNWSKDITKLIDENAAYLLYKGLTIENLLKEKQKYYVLNQGDIIKLGKIYLKLLHINLNNRDNEEDNDDKNEEGNKIEELKEEEKEEEKFDEDFGICPIKLEYMKHPMLAPSGNYYEKSAIIGWIKKNQTDPLTREKLTVDMLVEDKEYAKKIKEYKKKFRKQIRKLNK